MNFINQAPAASQAAAVIATVVALLATSQTAHAEFKVGAEVPGFSLATAADGSECAFARKGDQGVVTHGKKSLESKVLVLHLFQPDCLQCQEQMKALQKVHEKTAEKGVVVAGIAHRGKAEEVRAYGHRLKLTFLLVLGMGSELAKKFAAGDAFCIADGKAVVRYAQAGYGAGDEKLWLEAVEALLAGKPVTKETTEREGLKAGDRLPVIELASLMTGQPLTLKGEAGQLAFQDDTGKTIRPKAVVGMFSRYWDFTREEMVHLQKLSDKYAKDGLLVFAIALHPKSEEARNLTKQLGVTYPIFQGEGSDIARQLGFGWPAYIVDAGGVIRYTQIGFEAGDEKKYEKVIREVLKLK